MVKSDVIKKFTFLLFLFLLTEQFVFAKNLQEIQVPVSKIGSDSLIRINGQLLDKETVLPVHNTANIRVYNYSGDFIKETNTDSTGLFSFNLKKGDYLIKVKLDNYREFNGKLKVIKFNANNLFIAYLTSNKSQKEENYDSENDSSVLIGNIIITAKKSKIIMKGDTIQYDASQYKVRKGSLLQELLRKVPGLTIDKNGNIKANGKPVHKILIDGRQFFDNDIHLALTNLPSDMVKSIELYKESSDLSKITGIKEGDGNQVLNLNVKEEYKNSLFGNVSAGYGSNKRYNYKTLLNYLGKTTQISLLGDANNTNGSLDDIESYSDNGEGIISERTIGLNGTYENKNKLKVESNLLYNEEINRLTSTENTRYFLSDEERTSHNLSLDKQEQKNTSFGINLSSESKSNLTLFMRLSGNHQEKKAKTLFESQTFSNLNNTTRENSESKISGIANELRGSLTLGWKLNEKGRTLSLSLDGDYNHEKEDGNQKSQTFYDADSSEVEMDQQLVSKNQTSGYNATISYTEPIGKKSIFMASYAFQRMDVERNYKALNKNDEGIYARLDSVYTRESESYFNKQNIQLNFQTVYDKFEYALGVNAEPTESGKKIHIGSYTIQKMNQKIINYSTFGRFQYNPKKNKVFKFNYFGNVTQPGFEQITKDTTTISPTNKNYGNPDLKATSSNNFDFVYQKTNLNSGRFFSIIGNLNYISNQIVSYTFIDKLGNTASTYKNVNGNWGGNLNGSYNFPIKQTDLTLEFSLGSSYQRQLAFMNDQKSITDDYSVNSSISIDYNPGDLLLNLTGFYQNKRTENNLSSVSNLKITSWGITNLVQWDLPFDIQFQNYISYLYDHGYSSNVQKEKILWNMAISKSFLKGGKGELRLQLYDILNKRNNIMRVINGNQVSDIQSQVLKRYFLLSFIYRLGISG